MTRKDTLIKSIRKNQNDITRKITLIKEHISKLLSVVESQKVSMDMLRESNQDFNTDLANAVDMEIVDARDIYRQYCQLVSRNTLDRRTLEGLTILPKVVRKNPVKRVIKNRNNLMVVGDLVSNVRKMSEQREIGKIDKEIISSMLTNLLTEFK